MELLTLIVFVKPLLASLHNTYQYRSSCFASGSAFLRVTYHEISSFLLKTWTAEMETSPILVSCCDYWRPCSLVSCLQSNFETRRRRVQPVAAPPWQHRGRCPFLVVTGVTNKMQEPHYYWSHLRFGMSSMTC